MQATQNAMYDALSQDYDRFVNWEARLGFELPFITRQLQPPAAGRPASVLDAACGTGMHAIALAHQGFSVAAADLSIPMINEARRNAAKAGAGVDFKAAGFGALQAAFSAHPAFPFDAVLCLGNSLPHLLSLDDLGSALADFSACLRPGGLLLLQNRNFDALAHTRERWMEPQSHQEDDREWIFVRFYDYLPDQFINFNILTLYRESGKGWQQAARSTFLRMLLQSELLSALAANGFGQISCFGGMDGSPFQAESSGNLVVAALKQP